MQLNLHKGVCSEPPFSHGFFIGNSVFFIPKLHNVIRVTINNNLTVSVCNINYLNHEFEAKMFNYIILLQSDK